MCTQAFLSRLPRYVCSQKLVMRIFITHLEHLAIYSWHQYVHKPCSLVCSKLASYLGARVFWGQEFQKCQQMKHR